MKPINQMTIEEMAAEMRSIMGINSKRVTDKYIFVSYSHQDREKVYPVVLGWMQKGYNVYIDLDFVNHGSDQNWVTIMRSKIQSPSCGLVTAFRSKNSAFSYAALLELLTVRTDKTTKRHMGTPVPIDIITLENVPKNLGLDSEGVDSGEYIAYFHKLKANIGSHFGENNAVEREVMLDGFKSFFRQKREDLVYDDAEDMMELIDDGYQDGAAAFFSYVAMFTQEWLRNFDLNGNIKALDDDMEGRFASLKLKAVPPQSDAAPVSAPKVPAQEPPAAKPAPAPAAKPSAAATPPVKPAPAVKSAPAVKPAPAAQPTAKEAPAVQDYPRWFERTDKRAGLLKQTGEKEFVVLAGAEVRRDHTPTCPNQYLKLREELTARGVIAAQGDVLTLQEDVALTSLSTAAGILAASSINGKLFWQPCEAPAAAPAPLADSGEDSAPAPNDTASEADGAAYPRFYSNSNADYGLLRQDGEKVFVLCAGARLSADTTPSCPVNYLRLRESILSSGAAAADGSGYVLKEDVPFTSLSAAATVVTGRSINGRDFWQPADHCVENPAPGTPAAAQAAADLTIGAVRRRFAEDADFCIRVGQMRKNDLPWGGRGALDLAMAAVLGGCNSVKTPAQINYYKFAIADMGNKKGAAGLGATWTWSSNCRKILGQTGSGKIDADLDAFFAALPDDTTLNQILSRFERGEPNYRTTKNDLVIECLKRFMELK